MGHDRGQLLVKQESTPGAMCSAIKGKENHPVWDEQVAGGCWGVPGASQGKVECILSWVSEAALEAMCHDSLHSLCPQRSVESRGIFRPLWSFLCASVARGRLNSSIVSPHGMEIVGAGTASARVIAVSWLPCPSPHCTLAKRREKMSTYFTWTQDIKHKNSSRCQGMK